MKRLLLLGGGHAHLQVLEVFALERPRDWEVVLVTPHPHQVYSGMLPGWIAGHYLMDEIAIGLLPLADAAGARVVLDAATAVDADSGHVTTREHGDLAFDALSIDVGSGPPRALPGDTERCVGIRPVEDFAAAWEGLQRVLRGQSLPFHLAVVGDGPGGVELALGLGHRARREGWSHLHVRLLGTERLPLPSAPARARRSIARKLREAGVDYEGSRRVAALQPGSITLDDRSELAADACWLVTGSTAMPWLADSGLAVDATGYVRVDTTLRSASHPNVFVAGDAASHPRPLPKSGVYAVRGGAALAQNLLAHCEGRPLAAWKPQRHALYLLSTGDAHAVAIWWRLSWQGAWVWRWKDAIDRRFVQRFRRGTP